MIRSLAFVALLSLAFNALAADSPRVAPPEPSDMRCIFNGKDLTGWDGDPRLWSVKNGAIHGETTAENPAKGNTFIIWRDGRTKDFELRLSFRCTATNNSGIQYRSKHITEGKVRNKWVVRGYQHEIRNQLKLPSVSGFIYDEGGRRGRMCLVGEKAVWGADSKKKVTDTLITAEEYERLFKLDDWNNVVIIAKGDHIRHYLNGRLILDCTGRRSALGPARGYPRLPVARRQPDVGRVQEYPHQGDQVSDSSLDQFPDVPAKSCSSSLTRRAPGQLVSQISPGRRSKT